MVDRLRGGRDGLLSASFRVGLERVSLDTRFRSHRLLHQSGVHYDWASCRAWPASHQVRRSHRLAWISILFRLLMASPDAGLESPYHRSLAGTPAFVGRPRSRLSCRQLGGWG